MQKGLKIGDKAPDFSVVDENGNLHELKKYNGKKIVLFFYPKANTPGCTAEACDLSNNFEKFTSLNYVLLGVSADNIKNQKKFSDKFSFPFPLLADENKEIIQAYGVKSNMLGLIPGRVTYIVDKEGVVQMIFEDMNATNHLDRTVEKVKSLI
ncbi:peroxiredoxin [Flavobacterium columnare]|uniref:peroxiredoxin n=1 Tax=Flavobacterium columnare TaxID=996 RepID=UPI001BC86DBA|nr:peroxiredoxin [Flavobacterium columnare]AUX16951.1 hypothetical protein AQ623_00475 [Flavobacterium columnare]